MVLNYIWIAFFMIAFVVALVKLIFFGDFDVFPAMISSTFDTSKTAFEISLGLTGVLSLWLGIMKIGERGGLINALARMLSPVFTKLFPDIPKDHPASGSIFMNIAANMLGLDNAATPLGLKAMEQLQTLNPKKDTATNPMIMFLVLNTSGLTIIPISIMTYRAQLGAAQPTDIFIPILLATFFATLAGVIITSIYQRINLLNRTMILTLGSMCLAVAGIIWGFSRMDEMLMNKVSLSVANILLMVIIITFIWSGIRKHINCYDCEGRLYHCRAHNTFPHCHPRCHRCVSCLRSDGCAYERHQMAVLEHRLRCLVCGCPAHSPDETPLGKRCARHDGRYDDNIRPRFVRRSPVVHLPGEHRYHVLYPCRLFR